MRIYNLVVEVTRKCNITCNHCLRGEAINKNQKKEYVDSLLSQVNSIGSVCFTGGEPSLNVPIMEYFLEQCKEKNIYIDFFYIATNGVKVSFEFVVFLLKLYSYCDEKDMCKVHVSNDMYHRDETQYDLELLQGLSFFGKKFQKDGWNYYNGTTLITEGRMESKHNKPIFHQEESITSEELEGEVDVYLNCNGEIINGCDWSYKNQKKHKLCDVGDLTKYYESLKLQEIEVE